MPSLTPWSGPSASPLGRLRAQLEEMFDRFNEPAFGNGNGLTAWEPRVDVEESDKEVTVKADLPSVEPKDIDVRVEGGVLTIRGERKSEKEEKKNNYHRVERFAGSFYRAIPLPAGVDADKASAATAKGVVTVTVPKKREMQSKKVVVQSQE